MACSLPILLLVLLSLGSAQCLLTVTVHSASGLRPDQHSNADGYVKVSCGSASLGETNVYHDSPNPTWNKSFKYTRALQNDLLKLLVYDRDVAFHDKLGEGSTRIQKGT